MIYDCSTTTSASRVLSPSRPKHRSTAVGDSAEPQLVRLFAVEEDATLSGAQPVCDIARAESADLELYIGPARVYELSDADLTTEGYIRVASLGESNDLLPPRIIFKTHLLTPRRFRGYAPELIERLRDAGVFLVGVDAITAALGDTTRVLSECGMLNLEGLVLDHVPAGDYVLIALPLSPPSSEAVPVRAVLKSVV